MNQPAAKETETPVTTGSALRPERPILLLGLLLSCTSTLSGFGLLFLSGWFLAAAAVAGLGGAIAQNMFNIFLPAGGVRLFATLRIIARYLERIVTHDAVLRVTGHVRTSCFAALIPRSGRLSSHARSGDILTRFVNDTERMGQYPLDVTLPRQTAFICTIVSLLIIACFSLEVAGILGTGLFLGGVVLPFFLRLATDQTEAAIARDTGILRADIVENLQGMADILFCGAEKRRFALVTERQVQLNRHSMTYTLKGHIARQGLTVLSAVTMLPVLAFAASAYQNHIISGPEIAMFAMGCLASFEIIAPLPETERAITKAKRAEARVHTLCSQPHNHAERPSDHQPDTLPGNLENPTLQLNNICLSLAGHPVLDHVSLTIPPGARIALTGASGTGKTSIAKLLMRLTEPDHGLITFGDRPLAEFSTQDLARYIGLLTESPHIFHGSLRRNFLIAAPRATEEEMLTSLHVTGLYEDVLAMPDRLDTQCGEAGMRLSGGQIRRLAAAQIILRRPSVLILDEPTESLPPEQGKSLIAGILAHLPQTSVLCITHRPEPLAFMNKVFHLENGRLKEVTP